MKIKKTVKEAMKRLKIEKLRRNQIKPINFVLGGHDTLVIAPTSYGKSLLYQIPAVINAKKLTVVIEPLLALIHNQVEKLRRLGISAAYLDSTQSMSEREEVIGQLCSGTVTLLYLAPERLETGMSWTRMGEMQRYAPCSSGGGRRHRGSGRGVRILRYDPLCQYVSHHRPSDPKWRNFGGGRI